MKYLNRKFLRDIRQLKLQFIALVSIIMIGAFFYIGLTAISGSLVKYIDPYYEKLGYRRVGSIFEVKAK